MGAMLVGLATGIPLMIFVFFFTIVQTAVITFCAYKAKMSVLWWFIAALVMNSWVIIPFIFAHLKIATSKCHSCGANTKNSTGSCPCCGESVKKFDDKRFIKRILLAFPIALVVFTILETIIPLIITG